jgi:hypothetical protein
MAGAREGSTDRGFLYASKKPLCHAENIETLILRAFLLSPTLRTRMTSAPTRSEPRKCINLNETGSKRPKKRSGRFHRAEAAPAWAMLSGISTERANCDRAIRPAIRASEFLIALQMLVSR